MQIPLPQQRLFGFLLESVEGLASHSRAQDSDQLVITLMEGQSEDFDQFLEIWNRFHSGTDKPINKTSIIYEESGN